MVINCVENFFCGDTKKDRARAGHRVEGDAEILKLGEWESEEEVRSGR